MKKSKLKSHRPRMFASVLAGITLFVLYANTAIAALDPDPLQSVKDQVYSNLQTAPAPTNTGFTRTSYLETLDGIIGFFRTQQQMTGDLSSGLGSIIDPYTNNEKQYSTPYYALSGSVLYISGYNTDADFLESVALALDRALYELHTDTCADNHGNFFTIPCVLAYENLRDYVTASRRSQWETWLSDMTTASYASSTPNWMVTASCGEYLRYVNGFTSDTSFLETNLGNNIPVRLTLAGMYKDSSYPSDPMAYDGFARLNLELLLQHGYGDSGFPGSSDLQEYMRRGAWTSLLMQSPWGETPIGGRSAQHQWNETEMCFIYEVWADIKNSEGDTVAAEAFKRAAHLAYSSLPRWVRPSGELWIVKNRMNPAARWGYEYYSFHSQYNMWAAGFLSMAWMYANEAINEGPAPADIGGYAFDLPYFHKAFANCQGLYLQLDMDPDGGYNTAGLVRIHKAGVEPLVCPSASTSNVQILDGNPGLGMGIGWNDGSNWESLANLDSGDISSFTFNVNSMSSSQVDFSVTYNFSGVAGATSVTENYIVTPTEAAVNASVSGSATQTKMRYAAFVNDGERDFTVGYDNGLAQTKLNDSLMTMQLTSHPSTPFERTHSNVHSRNGYLEAIEGIVDGQSLSYTLRPELDPTGTLFTAANTFIGFDIPTPDTTVTFVDGTINGGTMTTLADGTPLNYTTSQAVNPEDVEVFTSGYGDSDGSWDCRSTYGNGGWIFQAQTDSDYSILKTTITDLTPGAEYNVYVYYWVADITFVGDTTTAGNAQWDIATGLAAGALTEYAWNDGVQVMNGRFDDPSVMFAEGNRWLFEAFAGEATADGNGVIAVYVSDVPGGDDRTWYEGVGYAALEPTTCEEVIVQGMKLKSDISGPSGVADCYVDIYDLTAVAVEWLSTSPQDADIAGPSTAEPDGSVNLYDFTLLASQWLTCNDPQDPNCQ
ncbi:MAG: hypothetical protein ABFR90_08445 [Planctomycetota bacterium]